MLKLSLANYWHSPTLCTLRSTMSELICSISAQILWRKSSKLFGILK
jgi:hypothetical protein